ncbi:MAG: type II toxin-antitoxin system RelE/ParE family toxin [bacterium]
MKHVAKRRRGIEDFVLEFSLKLAENPEQGKLIPGTRGILRKVRLADPSSGKGKRGGFRLIYAWREDFDSIILCIIYPKSDKPDASSSELEHALEEIESAL